MTLRPCCKGRHKWVRQTLEMYVATAVMIIAAVCSVWIALLRTSEAREWQPVAAIICWGAILWLVFAAVRRAMTERQNWKGR